jgi:hypothetical protein
VADAEHGSFLLKGIPFAGTLHVAIARVNCSAMAAFGGNARGCGCRTRSEPEN